MSKHSNPSRTLAIALGLSLSVHLAVAAVLARSAIGQIPTALTRETADEPPSVTLGIERSSRMTVTWLGVADPSPHQAPQSEVEQMALTLAAPASVPATPAVAPADQVTITPAPVEPTVPTPRALAPPPDPGPLIRSAIDPLARVVARAEAALARLEEQLTLAPAKPAEATPSDSPAEVARRDDHAEPTEPSPDSNRPGLASDRESPATARTRPVLVQPGKVIAGQGLRVKTRVGEFSIPTRLMGASRRPIFNVAFDRTGTVRSVQLVRSSGNANVDEPWRSALYQWTASGAQLDALPTDDPDARVTIQVELLAPKPY